MPVVEIDRASLDERVVRIEDRPAVANLRLLLFEGPRRFVASRRPVPGRCHICGRPLAVIKGRTLCKFADSHPVWVCPDCVMERLTRAAILLHYSGVLDDRRLTFEQRLGTAYVRELMRRDAICHVCGGGSAGRKCICGDQRMTEKVRDERSVGVVCRLCGWTGDVRLRKWKRPGHAAATGVPCPKCGRHRLRRARP